MIAFDQVTKRYGDAVAVDRLSLEIVEGETMMLLGPSGCGKTTSLKMINRLIEPTLGTITVAGEDTGAVDPVMLRRKIGYVIQQAGLFPHLTIAENIGTVPRLLGWTRDRITGRVEELLDLVGLDREVGPRLPRQLSGGQQQRVGVARALAADPPVLLMDEPFGALDPITRARLQQELLNLQKVVRKTIVFVSHDVEEAITVGTRIAVLKVGGVLAQVATPVELLGAPADEFVAGFMGRDRQLRRLSLVRVGDLGGLREPQSGDATLPRVDVEENLRSALDLLLESGSQEIAVEEGDRVVGVLSLEAIVTVGPRAR